MSNVSLRDVRVQETLLMRGREKLIADKRVGDVVTEEDKRRRKSGRAVVGTRKTRQQRQE